MTFKSQIFKTQFPNEQFYPFIQSFCLANDKYFVLSKTAFRKAQFHNILDPFIALIIPYYHSSKKYYIERKLNYTQFLTIIRQICKANAISFVSKVVYDKSQYEIVYYIYK